MKKCNYIIITLLLISLLASCSSGATNNSKKESKNTNKIEVKGLVLKYALIDTACEMYETNVGINSGFSKDNYKSMNSTTYEHYLWLNNTYSNLTPDMKNKLKAIFESNGIWQLMNSTTALDDKASLKDIVNRLVSDKQLNLSNKDKDDIKSFFPYFYNHFFKKYFHDNEKTYNKYATDLNKQLDTENIDILTFMESISGISFKTKYKVQFYYTLRPIGAVGFVSGNTKISTIQRNIVSMHDLFGAPFHEFSHEIFRNFTNSDEFQDISIKLKNNPALEKPWETEMHSDYDWTGWCEENLVEGFSKYLCYKYYGTMNIGKIYVYDLDFYNYLKNTNFDAHKTSLKDASINFYKQVLEKK